MAKKEKLIEEILLECIRPVTEEDRKRIKEGKLMKVSYSKLDLLKCPRKFKLRYIDGNYSEKSTVALDLGSLLHKVLELKGRDKIEEKETDYNYLLEVIKNGIKEETEKGSELIEGINVLSQKYARSWDEPDNKTGMNYTQKVQLFLTDVLPNEMEEPEWFVLGTEIPFEFIYKYGENKDGSPKEVLINGFIDRIDFKDFDNDENGEIIYKDLKVVDYKTSKAVFPDADIKTSLQHFTYDLACLFKYDSIPIWHEYDFICINQKQTTADGVCSKGYLKRGKKKLDKLLNSIDELAEENIYTPKPTPLCYWCDFADKEHTPNADSKNGGLCKYYSLWKPNNKTFEVKNKFDPENPYKDLSPKRKKFIF